jgi:hypothetical protein
VYRFLFIFTIALLPPSNYKYKRLKLAHQPFVVLTDPEAIKEAFAGANPPVLLRFVFPTYLIVSWIRGRVE